MTGKTKVTGFNIYKDKKNRDVYYDWLTKEAYMITKYEIKKLNFYQKRFIIPVIIFSLVYTIDVFKLKFGIMGAGAAALLSFICMEYLFRFRFLKSMIVVPNFVPDKKEGYVYQLANSAPLSNLIVKGLLYITLGVLLVVFGYQEGFQTIEWFACIIITIVVVFAGIIHLYASFIKYKEKK